MVAWSFFVFLGAVAPEDDVASRIARGRAALSDLEYEAAAEDLRIAATDERATKAQRFEANLYAGMANVVLGRDVQARLNFLHVLQRQPGYVLPKDTPPKISSFFDLVRDEVKFTTGVGREGEDIPKPIAPAGPRRTWAMWVGAVALGAGALVGAAALTAAGAVELYLADPGRPGDQRSSVALIGQLAVLMVVAAVLPVGAGAGLVVWGWLE